MTEDQAESMLGFLSEIKDHLGSIDDRIGQLDDKVNALAETVNDFRSLRDVAETFTRSGIFEDSFARQLGEEFNRDVVELLKEIKESVDTRLEALSDNSNAIKEKIDEVDNSIRNIEFPS